MKMGIIAEDDSDVAVIREITLLLLKPKPVSFVRFVGGGCGRLRRKCRAWAMDLMQRGCSWLIVVHDLDIYNEQKLRLELTASIIPARAKASVVLLPKREIEAWLLYDGYAIAGAFNESHPPRLPGNPESINDPKKYLRELIWKKYRKEYLNTIHNALIAKQINVTCLRKCSSFFPHTVFVETVKRMLA
jgi:hypothetical protein